MPKLLVVEASPRGEYSISRNLTTKFVEQWKAAHPEGEIVERDLAKMDLPYVNLPWLGASLTPIEQHNPEMKEVLRLSNELVAELLAADHLVISTPVYNYNIPANLKSYVDHIVRKGLTLGMKGEGLVRARSARSSWLREVFTPRARQSATATSQPCTCVWFSRSSASKT